MTTAETAAARCAPVRNPGATSAMKVIGTAKSSASASGIAAPTSAPTSVKIIQFGTIGVAICWDQWFPEAARAMALQGAEFLFYPTAIGTEPPDPAWDSAGHWQRVMQGHAGANLTPLVAANRIGHEVGRGDDTLGRREITFHGSSFIADPTGAKVAEADRSSETVLTATFDRDELREMRHSWGLFRDRRPDLYGPLLTLDGETGRRSGTL